MDKERERYRTPAHTSSPLPHGVASPVSPSTDGQDEDEDENDDQDQDTMRGKSGKQQYQQQQHRGQVSELPLHFRTATDVLDSVNTSTLDVNTMGGTMTQDMPRTHTMQSASEVGSGSSIRTTAYDLGASPHTATINSAAVNNNNNTEVSRDHTADTEEAGAGGRRYR